MPWPKGKPAHNRIDGPIPETYRCNKCGIEKPISEYYWKHNFRTCKECGNKKKDKVKIRNNSLQRNYGISLDDYNAMLKEQDGRCAICKSTEHRGSARVTAFFVDHCHATGAVRGLLCNSCNRALGNFGDDIATLQNAINYLQKQK